MKKIYALFAAALMSVSLFAEPTTVPTAQDLALKYDVANNVVLCCYFDVAPCNPVVLAGSYNGWDDDPAKCELFEELDGFDGWWVVQFSNEGNPTVRPLQLNNGTFDSWDFGAAGPDAWTPRGTLEATITGSGFGDEGSLTFPSNGAYIYEVAHWKNNNNPCGGDIKMHTYRLVLLPPATTHDFFTPAVQGAFNGWTSEALGEDFYQGKVAYTKTVNAAEGKEYKFLDLDFGWKNQFQYKDDADAWQNFENSKLPASDAEPATVVDVVIDYSDPAKYQYALEEVPFRDVTVNFTSPAGAPDAGVEMMGEFVGGENYGKGVLMEFDGDVYTATVKSVEAGEFKFREMGNWDNQIQVYTPAEEEGQEGTWKDMGNLQFGEYWEEIEGAYVANIDLSEPTEYKWTNYDPEEGIENIVLTEKAQKVVVDGVIYIIRNNKMYNLQGAQVR